MGSQIWSKCVFINLKVFQKVFFNNESLFYIKFNEGFKYFKRLKNKLKLTCIPLWLTLYAMTREV